MSDQRNGRMWARPIGPTVVGRREIWLPEHSAETRSGWEICPEPDVKTHKMIAFKFRLHEHERWVGKLIHSPKGEDLDEKGADGVSARDQIHLVLTGLLERATGGFLFQDSDEMQGKTWIDQWPEAEHCEERWNRFVRYLPPKRDSPQVIENL